MEENAAAFHTALNAAQALGRGFDVNYDTRLLYCKGVAGSRVVEIDEDHTRDLSLYDNLVLPNVSRDIKNFQEPGGRDGSSVCSYNEIGVIGDVMEENAAAFHTALNAAQALGRGFDVNYDTRLLYCKGVAGSRVVEIDEDHTRDLSLYDNLVWPNVSRDIKNFQEPGGRDGSSVCSYNEVFISTREITITGLSL